MATLEEIHAAEGVTEEHLQWLDRTYRKQAKELRYLAGLVRRNTTNADERYRKECSKLLAAYAKTEATKEKKAQADHLREIKENPLLDDGVVITIAGLPPETGFAVMRHEPSMAINGHATMSLATLQNLCPALERAEQANAGGAIALAKQVIGYAQAFGGVLRSFNEDTGLPGPGVQELGLLPPVCDLQPGRDAPALGAHPGAGLLGPGSSADSRRARDLDEGPGLFPDPAGPAVSHHPGPALPALADCPDASAVRGAGDPAALREPEPLGDCAPHTLGLPPPASFDGDVGNLNDEEWS